MKIQKSGSWVLWYECIGFGLLLLLLWLNELGDIAWLVGGEPHVCDLREGAVETVLIMAVWAGVFLPTRRLVAHLLYLEGFLRVCSWCRRVGYQGEWIKVEEYFARGFHVSTTHGVCPECLKKLEEDTRQYFRERG